MAEAQNSETELTMCDVLEEEKELEDDANAVLGGSDDKNCSYDQGYVSRQALYACTSCSVDGSAGVCLACCYACHDGHDVVELYTKRNFRCDCGNSKFSNSECKLNPKKDIFNVKNKYNQNFKGLYCTCSRPYPDLEDSTPDEMIQCVICEDWYHGRHLGVMNPDDYYEMVCGRCMDNHPFLFPYLNKYDPIVDVVKYEMKSEEASLTKTVESGTEKTESIISDIKLEQVSVDSELKSEKIEDSIDIKMSPTKENALLEESLPTKFMLDGTLSGSCVLKALEKDTRIRSGAAFWPESWRKDLCRCSDCMKLYCDANCEYLLDPEDTIQAYEERGKRSDGESQYDKGLSALGQLDRVNQMEAIRAYTNMKGKLKEYLKEFADNKRTVRECDIKEFFERIGKKQKLNNGVPHFCR